MYLLQHTSNPVPLHTAVAWTYHIHSNKDAFSNTMID
jgi:hypothetical protein